MRNNTNLTFKTLLPFVGFYQTIFESLIDSEIEIMIDCLDNENAKQLKEMFSDGMDYSNAFSDIAKDYAQWLLINLNTYLRHDGFKVADLPDDFGFNLVSPKYYNFETDKIWVTLPVGFLPSPVEFDNKHTEYGMIFMLGDSVCDNYTSYDGFISIVPNVITDELLDGDFDKANPYHIADYLCLLCDYYFADLHDDVSLASRLTDLWLEVVLGDGYFSELVHKHCKNWCDIKHTATKLLIETEQDYD